MSTKIQWLWPPGYKGETWNVVTGEALITLHPDRLDKPLHWRNPRCIFVNSVSDLFHKEVPFDFVDAVFAVMSLTSHHRYIILTKRPERMEQYVRDRSYVKGSMLVVRESGWPLYNVWLGTSIENQHWMKQRGDIMKEIDWPNKLASFEPLLGPIDPTGYEKTFQWFVIGGESGPGARPMHPLWGSRLWHYLIPHAPGFWKQWGQWRPAEDIHYYSQFLGRDSVFKDHTGPRRPVHYNPKSTTDAIDDRLMVKHRSTQVYGGEWTEGRDIHRWPKSMKLEEVKNATR